MLFFSMVGTTVLFAGWLPVAGAVERHFNITIAMRMAMEYGENCDELGQHCEPNYLAYEKDGRLLYRKSNANTGLLGEELEVPLDADMLVIDGTYRAVTTINGQVPGPTIEVDEGDTVVVHLWNKLDNAATTLHFHGMYQRGTPWMDGVSQVTQCAVLPGASFTYRFVAEPAGTHFYHSHHGVQRPEGIFGALVIHPKSRGSIDEPRQCSDGKRQVMLLSVWQHIDSESLYVQRDGPGWYPNGPEAAPWTWTRDVSGKLVGEIPMKSGLINGRGRVGRGRTNLTVFDVPSGPASSHCFRAIASQEGKALRVSVDGHELTVLASDGHDIEPLNGFQSIIIFPGETVDISVTRETVDSRFRSASPKLYWIRAETLEVGYGEPSNHSALGILRYVDADTPHSDESVQLQRDGGGESAGWSTDPTTSPRACTERRPCKVFNCPFPSFLTTDFTTCIPIDAARNRLSADDDPVPGGDSTRFADHSIVTTELEGAEGQDARAQLGGDAPGNELLIEKFLNFGFEPSINNRRFVYPEAPPLTQLDQARMHECDDALCDAAAFPSEPCECTHYLSLPFNRTIQLVLTNLGTAAFGMHPMHLHGHSFQVLKLGLPPVYPTGSVCAWPAGDEHPTCKQSQDIECIESTGCARARWRNDEPPTLNFNRPPRKDTVVIPPGGYVVVRFRTDNPGWWHLHCHMAHHMQSGMGMVISEAPELQQHFPPPLGFPQCGGMPDSTILAQAVDKSVAAWGRLRQQQQHPHQVPVPGDDNTVMVLLAVIILAAVGLTFALCRGKGLRQRRPREIAAEQAPLLGAVQHGSE